VEAEKVKEHEMIETTAGARQMPASSCARFPLQLFSMLFSTLLIAFSFIAIASPRTPAQKKEATGANDCCSAKRHNQNFGGHAKNDHGSHRTRCRCLVR
jgi:hypothetical protein